MPEQKSDLPKRVRVGCYNFTIEEWDSRLASAADRFGECDKYNNIIRVRTDVSDQRKAEVLMHEILHAVWDVGCCDGGDEEKIVCIMAIHHCQLWQDNPKVMQWIADKARAKG